MPSMLSPPALSERPPVLAVQPKSIAPAPAQPRRGRVLFREQEEGVKAMMGIENGVTLEWTACKLEPTPLASATAIASGRGGLLADEPGMGKTLQVLELVRRSDTFPGPPTVVVAQITLLNQWEVEARAAGFSNPLLVDTRTPMPSPEVLSHCGVIITSYSVVIAHFNTRARAPCVLDDGELDDSESDFGDEEEIAPVMTARTPWLFAENFHFHRLVADEAAVLCNMTTMHSRAMVALADRLADPLTAAGGRVWYVSATPVQNDSTRDIVAALRFVNLRELSTPVRERSTAEVLMDAVNTNCVKVDLANGASVRPVPGTRSSDVATQWHTMRTRLAHMLTEYGGVRSVYRLAIEDPGDYMLKWVYLRQRMIRRSRWAAQETVKTGVSAPLNPLLSAAPSVANTSWIDSTARSRVSAGLRDSKVLSQFMVFMGTSAHALCFQGASSSRDCARIQALRFVQGARIVHRRAISGDSADGLIDLKHVPVLNKRKAAANRMKRRASPVKDIAPLDGVDQDFALRRHLHVVRSKRRRHGAHTGDRDVIASRAAPGGTASVKESMHSVDMVTAMRARLSSPSVKLHEISVDLTHPWEVTAYTELADLGAHCLDCVQSGTSFRMNDSSDETDSGSVATLPHVFSVIMRLRQLCCGIYDGSNERVRAEAHASMQSTRDKLPAKLRALANMLIRNDDGIADRGFLLMSHWIKPLKLVATVLNRMMGWRLDHEVIILHGTLTRQQRFELLDRLNLPGRDGIMVCLATTQVGGVGLNLGMFNDLIVWTRGWNPAALTQTVARIDRPGGRPGPLSVYLMHVNHSIEEHVRNIAADKGIDGLRMLGDSCVITADTLGADVWKKAPPVLSVSSMRRILRQRPIIPSLDPLGASPPMSSEWEVLEEGTVTVE